MAVTSNRTVTITFTGDVLGTETPAAAANAASPGTIEIKTLTSGANTITVPTGGTTPTAVTIIPPAGNTVTLTVKGVTGDTGVAIHLTDPTTLALASSVTTFCLTTSNTLTGIRFIWT
jgi:DnaJ-class molecular chaperone